MNFMLAMTLQLIPVFEREFGIILSAQKSRGMKGRGFAAVLPSFIPVFVGAIERVQQLSISLESRGFGSAGVKTSYRQVRARPSDWVIGILGAAVIATLATVSIMKGTWNLGATIHFPPLLVVWVFVVAASLFLGIIVVTLAFMFKR